jgi:hypothetical protein
MIATVVLVLSALIVNGVYKQYLRARWRMQQAETHYAAVLSLRDELATAPAPFATVDDGTIGEIPYRYEADLVRETTTTEPLVPGVAEKEIAHRSALYRITVLLEDREYALHLLRIETMDGG